MRVNLSLSENEFYSEKALERMKKFSKINLYKLSQDSELLELVSERIGVGKENILVTAGCDYALHHVAEAFVEVGDKVIIPVPCFGRYEFHAKICGGIPVFITFSQPPNEIDLEVVLNRALEEGAKLIYIGNPNNPTGHLLSKREIEEFISEVKDSVVVIDEALIDALPKESSCADLVELYPNLIVTRSFSKFYGLAGMRIGYMVADKEVIKHVSKTVSPFEVSSLSIELAKAVLLDEEFQRKARKRNEECTKMIKKHSPLPVSNTSAAVALVYGNEAVQDLYHSLLSRGILTVNGKCFRGLEKINCVRVALYNKENLKILIQTLKELVER